MAVLPGVYAVVPGFPGRNYRAFADFPSALAGGKSLFRYFWKEADGGGFVASMGPVHIVALNEPEKVGAVPKVAATLDRITERSWRMGERSEGELTEDADDEEGRCTGLFFEDFCDLCAEVTEERAAIDGNYPKFLFGPLDGAAAFFTFGVGGVDLDRDANPLEPSVFRVPDGTLAAWEADNPGVNTVDNFFAEERFYLQYIPLIPQYPFGITQGRIFTPPESDRLLQGNVRLLEGAEAAAFVAGGGYAGVQWFFPENSVVGGVYPEWNENAPVVPWAVDHWLLDVEVWAQCGPVPGRTYHATVNFDTGAIVGDDTRNGFEFLNVQNYVSPIYNSFRQYRFEAAEFFADGNWLEGLSMVPLNPAENQDPENRPAPGSAPWAILVSFNLTPIYRSGIQYTDCDATERGLTANLTIHARSSMPPDPFPDPYDVPDGYTWETAPWDTGFFASPVAPTPPVQGPPVPIYGPNRLVGYAAVDPVTNDPVPWEALALLNADLWGTQYVLEQLAARYGRRIPASDKVIRFIQYVEARGGDYSAPYVPDFETNPAIHWYYDETEPGPNKFKRPPAGWKVYPVPIYTGEAGGFRQYGPMIWDETIIGQLPPPSEGGP